MCWFNLLCRFNSFKNNSFTNSSYNSTSMAIIYIHKKNNGRYWHSHYSRAQQYMQLFGKIKHKLLDHNCLKAVFIPSRILGWRVLKASFDLCTMISEFGSWTLLQSWSPTKIWTQSKNTAFSLLTITKYRTIVTTTHI